MVMTWTNLITGVIWSSDNHWQKVSLQQRRVKKITELINSL